MENSIVYYSDNSIKLSERSIEDLLEPIPEEVIIEKVALIKGWKTKRLPLSAGQTKRDYFLKNVGSNMALSLFRELRILREHSLISTIKWNIFNWDKSIARYYPDKIDKKISVVLHELSSTVNLDLLLVDEETKTIFLLLEMWQKEVVADTFLSKVETNIPKYFRAYISIDKKLLLVEDKSDQATQDFINIIEKAFTITTNKLRVNAMLVREFVKQIPKEITRLVVRLPQEVAGFAGLSKLTFYGDNVILGSRGLMNRHETSPIDVGPWTGASSSKISIDVGQSIKVKTIKDAIWLYEIMRDLY